MLTPIMEQVKTKFSDVSFQDVNIDEQFEVCQKYYVRSVPTVIIEKDGKEVQRFGGLQIGDGLIQMFPQRIKN